MRLTKLSRSVQGKVVVVTGAASGMGKATAELFADEGAHVAAIDLTESALNEVVATINEAGKSAKAWVLDLADAEDYPALWHKSIAVLLTAHTLTIRASLPYLRQSEHPRIINIASTEALGATKFGSPYTAAKSGVTGLTRSLAVELGDDAITVNCVCPGPINTGMTSAIPEENKAIFARRRTALKRYAEPEEVAHATLNLALPASQYMTGVTLPVDGGLTIRNA